MSVPSSQRTSTHEVLPPKRSVLGPGLATDPRVPQKCVNIAVSLSCGGQSRGWGLPGGQDGLYLRAKVGHPDWLRQHHHGASPPAFIERGTLRGCRQQDHWNVGKRRIGSQRIHQLKPIEHWH